jgi:aerobic carbon-monoxide dehydrogenase small subunit
MNVTINGVIHDLSGLDPDLGLLDYLREHLDLTGAKDGCAIGVCGACTVLVDGAPSKACMKKLRDVAGKVILTIEGLAPEGGLHPLQQAFLDAGAVQSGFCTPGMVLTAHAFLLRHPAPTRAEIRRAINPNLCRCTGYHQIVDAIERAAKQYQGAS